MRGRPLPQPPPSVWYAPRTIPWVLPEGPMAQRAARPAHFRNTLTLQLIQESADRHGVAPTAWAAFVPEFSARSVIENRVAKFHNRLRTTDIGPRRRLATDAGRGEIEPEEATSSGPPCRARLRPSRPALVAALEHMGAGLELLATVLAWFLNRHDRKDAVRALAQFDASPPFVLPASQHTTPGCGFGVVE